MADRCCGITGPLDKTKPSQKELNSTEKLEAALAELKVEESQDEYLLRREALSKLQIICNKWIYKKALEINYPPHVARTVKGKLFTFGSYRLGVNFSGADIDTLLVVPNMIIREAFFTEFVEILREDPSAEEVVAVPNAFVPVLSLIHI